MAMKNNLHYARYRERYINGPKLNLTEPVDVSLELASHCNMRCSYCYHSDQEKLPFQKGFMSWQTAEMIVTEAFVLRVPSLKMNWKGEATTNPIFPRVTHLAKSLAHDGIFIDRLTNSNFKFATDKEEIFEGLCNQTKVKISYDSFSKEVFETQRAGGNHDLTTRNIDKFYNHPMRKETEIVIQAVRTKLNKDEDIEGEARKRWKEATISIRDCVGGRVDKDVTDLEDHSREGLGRQSCIQAHVRIIFNWAGVAFPCCPDVKEELAIGDIYRESMREIFNSIKAKNLREELKSGKAFDRDPCKSCSSFESYQGYIPVLNS